MATPFDHLPKFQRLPPEAQKQIMDRFNTKPEEEKMQIMGKIGTPMSAQDQDPGLQDISTTPLTKSDFNAADVTEGLAIQGVNPKLAKAVGTAFEMIPTAVDTAITVGGTGAVAKGAIKQAPAMAKGIVNTAQAVKSGFTGVRDALKGTGEKEVMALSEKAAELPLRQTALQESALRAKKAAQKGIQTAEEKAGIGMSNTPSTVIRGNLKTPNKVVQFADRMERVTKGGSKGLEKASTKVLSHYRETTKAALKDKTLPQDVRIRLEKAQTVLNDAISPRVPEVGVEISRFKDTIQVLEKLGPQFKKEKQMLQLAMKKAQNLAKTQKAIRTGAKWVAGGGATGVGFSLGKKLLGS